MNIYVYCLFQCNAWFAFVLCFAVACPLVEVPQQEITPVVIIPHSLEPILLHLLLGTMGQETMIEVLLRGTEAHHPGMIFKFFKFTSWD